MEKIIEQFPDKDWHSTFLISNHSLSLEYIFYNIDKFSDVEKLIHRKDITEHELDIIKLHQDVFADLLVRWNPWIISNRYVCTCIDCIDRKLHRLGWHPGLTLYVFLKYNNIVYCENTISEMPIEMIKQYLTEYKGRENPKLMKKIIYETYHITPEIKEKEPLFENVEIGSCHHGVTLEYVMNHPEIKWDYNLLVYNPGITLEDIHFHPELPWGYNEIRFRSDLTIDFVRSVAKNIDKIILANLASNISFSIDDVMENRDLFPDLCIGYNSDITLESIKKYKLDEILCFGQLSGNDLDKHWTYGTARDAKEARIERWRKMISVITINAVDNYIPAKIIVSYMMF
jgi:hypothetical protein